MKAEATPYKYKTLHYNAINVYKCNVRSIIKYHKMVLKLHKALIVSRQGRSVTVGFLWHCFICFLSARVEDFDASWCHRFYQCSWFRFKVYIRSLPSKKVWQMAPDNILASVRPSLLRDPVSEPDKTLSQSQNEPNGLGDGEPNTRH